MNILTRNEPSQGSGSQDGLSPVLGASKAEMRQKSKAPEPSPVDIEKAAHSSAWDVFNGSDGRLTVAFYRRLQSVGPIGKIAMNLFRAQKTSSRAKVYRARKYTASSYDVKNYSLQELSNSLSESTLRYGWKLDPCTPGYEWVLYVELPTGQVSFHSASRLAGPSYTGDWDGARGTSVQRILSFVDSVLGQNNTAHEDSVGLESKRSTESVNDQENHTSLPASTQAVSDQSRFGLPAVPTIHIEQSMTPENGNS